MLGELLQNAGKRGGDVDVSVMLISRFESSGLPQEHTVKMTAIALINPIDLETHYSPYRFKRNDTLLSNRRIF